METEASRGHHNDGFHDAYPSIVVCQLTSLVAPAPDFRFTEPSEANGLRSRTPLGCLIRRFCDALPSGGTVRCGRESVHALTGRSRERAPASLWGISSQWPSQVPCGAACSHIRRIEVLRRQVDELRVEEARVPIGPSLLVTTLTSYNQGDSGHVPSVQQRSCRGAAVARVAKWYAVVVTRKRKCSQGCLQPITRSASGSPMLFRGREFAMHSVRYFGFARL